MTVRYLEPRRPDETDEQYQERVRAYDQAVEEDGASLRRIRERVDAHTRKPTRWDR